MHSFQPLQHCTAADLIEGACGRHGCLCNLVSLDYLSCSLQTAVHTDSCSVLWHQEGELRPQLLDRFGLSVAVGTMQDTSVRTQMVLDCLAYEAVSAAAHPLFSSAGANATWHLSNQACKARASNLLDQILPMAFPSMTSLLVDPTTNLPAAATGANCSTCCQALNGHTVHINIRILSLMLSRYVHV